MTKDEFAKHFDVSRETLERLDAYRDLLVKWNPRINLVSKNTIDDMWRRHFIDSAQLTRFAKPDGHWVDLGSGGGFPGLVVAVMNAQKSESRITLVEADQRKSAFLRSAIRELEIDARVISERIEEVSNLNANVLSARALAPLVRLLAFVEQHMSTDGCALFPKGEKADQEIAEALEHWQFHCEKHPSITDANATVLSIGDVTRV